MSVDANVRIEGRQHLAVADTAFEATLWDDALREYEAALALVSEHGDAVGLDEAELLTRVGACHWNMAEARTAWRALRRAIAMFRDRGDGVGMARATVEILRIWGPWERQLQMADEALAALGSREPYLRARLLLSTSWRGRDERWDECIRIAEQHGFADILASKIQDQSYKVYRESGDIEASIALAERAHLEYSRLKAYDPACGSLRGSAFGTMEHGLLDRGADLAWRCVEYARSVHLRFHEQLALMDLAGEAFARADYVRCGRVLDEMPSNTDFRGDLYRMWMLELSGDSRGAVQIMVDPERAGRAATGMSQTHGAAAGVLFRAGIEDAAKREMEQWAEIAANPEDPDLAIEAPALFECIAALGDDELVREVCASYEVQTAVGRVIPAYATLQGRACAPAHGAMLLRLGRIDEAELVYREGLAWCERERVPVDAGHCLAGLSAVAAARGDAPASEDLRAQARATYERHGAKLYLHRLSD
jgi:hypothetical protein